MLYFCTHFVYNFYIPKILVAIKNSKGKNMEIGKQWIYSAEAKATKWEDGKTRWSYKIEILNSENPHSCKNILSRTFDKYEDCIQLMNDRIQVVYMENEENGFPFNIEDARKRFDKENYTTKEVA